MPRIVITHAVADIERWLEGKAERAAAIESGSGSNVTDFVAQGRKQQHRHHRRRGRRRRHAGDVGLTASGGRGKDARARRRASHHRVRRSELARGGLVPRYFSGVTWRCSTSGRE